MFILRTAIVQASRRGARSSTRLYSTRTQSSSAPTFARWIVPLALGAGGAQLGIYWQNRTQYQIIEAPVDRDIDLSIEPADNTIFKALQPPDDAEIDRSLNADAHVSSAKSIAGVSSYHTAQLPSNAPCEDQYVCGYITLPFKQPLGWGAWGIYDGHAGWQFADFLRQTLVYSVYDKLRHLPLPDGKLTDLLIQEGIKDAFSDVDDFVCKNPMSIINSELSSAEKAARLVMAYSGSCALLSLFDPNTRRLHVAVTGDSRAVLAVQDDHGEWITTALSQDQQASTPSEVARLKAEHPRDDPKMIDGRPARLFGIMVTRAFGDMGWKWPADVQELVKKHFNGPTRVKNLKSPPYLTARPEVTSTNVEAGKPAFMIMASDGLWDTISNEQAVQLVDEWLKWRNEGKPPQPPVDQKQFKPFDLADHGDEMWQYEARKLALKDDNVAVHLVRNAMGGRHEQMLQTALTYRPPSSRTVRDDITVQVVFFDPSNAR